MAQLAEQLICNQQVIGSSPIIGFVLIISALYRTISYAIYGWIPEWPKGTDCKSAANCFGGSNPPPSICLMAIQYYIAGWSSLEARRAHNPKVAGSNPAPAIYAQIAQLVEQRTENPRVTGSIPVLGIFLLYKYFYWFKNTACLSRFLIIFISFRLFQVMPPVKPEKN